MFRYVKPLVSQTDAVSVIILKETVLSQYLRTDK